MHLSEIISILENIAPLSFAAKWDNAGMQVASIKQDVKHIALCLDPTPKCIDLALQSGAEFIISHHPLLMQGRLPSKIDAYHHVLRLLFANDVALYAAHTSLDVNGDMIKIVPSNEYPPVAWLANELNLQECETLEPVGLFTDMFGTERRLGYGIVGNLEEPLRYFELWDKLALHIQLETAVVCGIIPERIRRIAYCTGAGSSFMQKAKDLNADIFITGDVKHHFAIDTPLCMLDVGHHSLEEEMMRRFAHILATALPTLKVTFIPSQAPLKAAKPNSRA